MTPPAKADDGTAPGRRTQGRQGHCVEAPTAARRIGALNFYDERPHGFDDDANAAATRCARHATVVAAYFDRADEADNLQRAIQPRAVIEQAKGIIIASTGSSPDGAFEILRQQSQAEDRKVRDVARALVGRQRWFGR